MFDLKPCPHCGNKVDFAYDLDLIPYGIQCARCHMIVRFTRVKKPGLKDPFGIVMTDIATRWNERKGE